MKMNKKGVSAVVGVILMVAITVAVASTVYVYVSGTLLYEDESIEGNVTDKIIVGSPGYRNLDYWFIIDETFDIEVDIETYYSYNIGDYYCNCEEE